MYKSGTGIIAYGIATGKLEMQECNGHHNYEYSMKLDQFNKLKTPLTASEMKTITNQGFNFRQTMFSINEENKDLLLSEIRKNYL